MKELSLHIMDILQNSIAAGAKLIELYINEQPEEDYLEFIIKDNGCGMDEKTVSRVIDPYTTGRTTRRVGLGIPLLKLACENTGGNLKIVSVPKKGTTVFARFGYNHIDREPLGDIAGTMHQIITSYEEIDFIYRHIAAKKSFGFDTRELKKILNGVSFKSPDVLLWLLDFLKEGEAETFSERQENEF